MLKKLFILSALPLYALQSLLPIKKKNFSNEYAPDMVELVTGTPKTFKVQPLK